MQLPDLLDTQTVEALNAVDRSGANQLAKKGFRYHRAILPVVRIIGPIPLHDNNIPPRVHIMS